MEIWEIVGVDTRAEVNIKAENKVIKGVKWYMVGDAPAADGRFLGRVTRDQFISNERLAQLNVAPKPGQTVTLYFNRYGDIVKVDVA